MILDKFIESLSDSDGKILIGIARNAIMENKNSLNVSEKLEVKAGAFVTLSENNNLRRCIGLS